MPGAVGRDARRPNSGADLEKTTRPSIHWRGPFANIAHGCKLGDRHQDALEKAGRLRRTEKSRGFGADLGAEKFRHQVPQGRG